MSKELYLIALGNNICKVGISQNALSRHKGINHGLPYVSNLVYVKKFDKENDCKLAEQNILKIFSKNITRGEWFELNFLEVLHKIIELYGNSDVKYEFVEAVLESEKNPNNKKEDLIKFLSEKKNSTLNFSNDFSILMKENIKILELDRQFENLFESKPMNLSNEMSGKINEFLSKNNDFIVSDFGKTIQYINNIEGWNLKIAKDTFHLHGLPKYEGMNEKIFNEIQTKFIQKFGISIFEVIYDLATLQMKFDDDFKEYTFNNHYYRDEEGRYRDKEGREKCALNPPVAYKIDIQNQTIYACLIHDDWISEDENNQRPYPEIMDANTFSLLADILDFYGWKTRAILINKDTNIEQDALDFYLPEVDDPAYFTYIEGVSLEEADSIVESIQNKETLPINLFRGEGNQKEYLPMIHELRKDLNIDIDKFEKFISNAKNNLKNLRNERFKITKTKNLNQDTKKN